jgi:DNA-binding MarR family transcriptional regulator
MLRTDPIQTARDHWEAHGWTDAAPAMSVVTSIMRVQQLLMARVDAVLRPHGLTFARYEVLMLLTFSSRGSMPLGKIGERLQVHPASVTNAIDRLEAQRLVRRVPHPTDRRTTLAALTPKGRAAAERATVDMNELFTSLELPDADGLFGLLREMREGDFRPSFLRRSTAPTAVDLRKNS